MEIIIVILTILLIAVCIYAFIRNRAISFAPCDREEINKRIKESVTTFSEWPTAEDVKEKK